MSKRSVYHAVKVTPAIKAKIRGSVHTGIHAIYRGSVRAELARLHLPDRAIGPITDKRLQRAADLEARRVAHACMTTYNRLLRGALKAMPNGLSSVEIHRRLDSFISAAERHDRTVLMPFIKGKAETLARQRFYAINGVVTQWQIQPVTTDSNDPCLDAIDAGTTSLENLIALSPSGGWPAHPGCPHETVPVDVNRDAFPGLDAMNYLDG